MQRLSEVAISKKVERTKNADGSVRNPPTQEWQRTYKTEPIEYTTSLGFGIGNTDIPNGVSIKIDFELAKKEFVVVASNKTEAENKGYRALIKEMKLLIPCAQLSDTLFNSFNSHIKTRRYVIPHIRSEIITHTVGINKTTYETDRLFIGSSLTPAKVIIGFVPTTAYLGSYDTNPFNFMHNFGGATSSTSKDTCRVIKQKLTLNGTSIDGLDYTSESLSYVKMLNTLNMFDTGFTNSVTRLKFIGGSYLVPYDLTTSPGWSSSSLVMPKIRDGQYRYFIIIYCNCFLTLNPPFFFFFQI